MEGDMVELGVCPDLKVHFDRNEYDDLGFLEIRASTKHLQQVLWKVMTGISKNRDGFHVTVVVPSAVEALILRAALGRDSELKDTDPADRWTEDDGGKYNGGGYNVLTYWEARGKIIHEPDSLKDITWLCCLDMYIGYRFVAFWTELLIMARGFRAKRIDNTAKPFDKMFVVTISCLDCWPIEVFESVSRFYADVNIYVGQEQILDLNPASTRLTMYHDWREDIEVRVLLKSIPMDADAVVDEQGTGTAPLIVICGGDAPEMYRSVSAAQGGDLDIYIVSKRTINDGERLAVELAPNPMGGTPKIIVLDSDLIHLPIPIYGVTNLLICPTRTAPVMDLNTSKVATLTTGLSRDEIMTWMNLMAGPGTIIRAPDLHDLAPDVASSFKVPQSPTRDIHQGDIMAFTLLFHDAMTRTSRESLAGNWILHMDVFLEMCSRLTVMGLLQQASGTWGALTEGGRLAIDLLDLAEGDVHMARFLSAHVGKSVRVQKTMARMAASFMPDTRFWQFGDNARHHGVLDFQAIQKVLWGPTKSTPHKGKCHIDVGILTRILGKDERDTMEAVKEGGKAVSKVRTGIVVLGNNVIKVNMSLFRTVMSRHEAIARRLGLHSSMAHEGDEDSNPQLTREEVLDIHIELMRSYVSNWLFQGLSSAPGRALDITSVQRGVKLGDKYGSWSRNDKKCHDFIYRTMVLGPPHDRYVAEDIVQLDPETVARFVEEFREKWGTNVSMLRCLRTMVSQRPNGFERREG